MLPNCIPMCRSVGAYSTNRMAAQGMCYRERKNTAIKLRCYFNFISNDSIRSSIEINANCSFVNLYDFQHTLIVCLLQHDLLNTSHCFFCQWFGREILEMWGFEGDEWVHLSHQICSPNREVWNPDHSLKFSLLL